MPTYAFFTEKLYFCRKKKHNVKTKISFQTVQCLLTHTLNCTLASFSFRSTTLPIGLISSYLPAVTSQQHKNCGTWSLNKCNSNFCDHHIKLQFLNGAMLLLFLKKLHQLLVILSPKLNPWCGFCPQVASKFRTLAGPHLRRQCYLLTLQLGRSLSIHFTDILSVDLSLSSHLLQANQADC